MSRAVAKPAASSTPESWKRKGFVLGPQTVFAEPASTVTGQSPLARGRARFLLVSRPNPESSDVDDGVKQEVGLESHNLSLWDLFYPDSNHGPTPKCYSQDQLLRGCRKEDEKDHSK